MVLDGAEAFSADGGDQGVLLCHGFTGTPQGLRPWAQTLADAGLTVRLPRLPGHGTTWQQMARTGWPDWVAAVREELVALRRQASTVVVGGLSMGGALALRLAADHPADVDGLVLVNPGVRQEDKRMLAVPLMRHLTATAPGVTGDIAKEGAVEIGYDRVPLSSLHSYLTGCRRLRADLSAVRAPLVLLRSAVDHVVPASSSALVLRRVSSADVREEVLPRSHHVATLDHDADRIAQATLELVRRVSR